MNAMPRSLKAMVLLVPLALISASCATSSHESGYRRWRPEPIEEVFADQPPERVRVALEYTTHAEDSVVVLEGARLEADSVIGFRETEDGGWRRIAVAADSSTHLEVLKVQPDLVFLGIATRLALLALISGG